MNADIPSAYEVRRGYVDGRWGQVHYRSAGVAGATLVLLHESPLSSLVYQDVLSLIARGGVRVVAFDTPGYGMSDPPDRPMEIPDYARSLLDAANELGIEEYVVAGSHTGASLAVQVALQAGPRRVLGAMLSGVVVLEPDRRQWYLENWCPRMKPLQDGAHMVEAWERFTRIYGDETEPDLIHLAAVGLLSCVRTYDWAYNAAFRYDPAPDLPNLEIPVHFLIAEHDGFVDADRHALRMVRSGTIEVVPALRGQIPMRAPEFFAAEAVRFTRHALGETFLEH